MANKTKITEEVSKKILELHNLGLNNLRIGKEIGIARDTVKSYLLKIGLVPNSRHEGIKKDQTEAFIKEVRENDGADWTVSRKKYGFSFDKAKKILEQSGVAPSTRAESGGRKVLDFSEANDRIPQGHGHVIGFKNGKYEIKTSDGFIYYKNAARLHQGDPRGKSGTLATLDRVRLFLDSLNYTYIEGFSRVRDPLTARHNVCGNIRENRLKNFKDQDCPYCAEKGVSKIELEILEWVRTFYPEAKKYYIKKKPDEVATGRKLEIDIYIEEIGLGIEYCGLHWHSENYNIMDMTAEQLHEESEESKHYKKMLRAKENGIRVITVFGNEWHHREEQVRAYIQSAMGKNTIKIHGRKTEVRPIDKHVADDFFEKYHIQGKEPHSFLFWGLFHKNELVGAISAGRHPQRASEYPHSLCLNRMAFKAQTTVVGGANKLFQALKKQAIKMKYRDIMSWSDNKWSEGDIYKKLGFEFSSEKEKGLSRGLSDGSIFPECFYVKGLNLLSRSAAKRQGLESKLKIIWDCGKKRWVYSL